MVYSDRIIGIVEVNSDGFEIYIYCNKKRKICDSRGKGVCMVVIFVIKKKLEFLKRFIYNLNIELYLKKKVNFRGKVG